MKTLIILIVFLFSGLLPAQESEEWNQWKGPTHEGKSLSKNLLDQWPENGPPLLWKAEGLGAGYSNFSFWKDRMFTEGDFENESFLLALDRNNGKTIWKTRIGPGGPIGGHVGTKSTPATDGKFVYGLNQTGFLICTDIDSGKILWTKNLYDDFGGKMPANEKYNGIHWGYASSPILDGNKLIIMPGGSQGTVFALDKTTGKTIWRSKDLTDSSPYCTPVPTVIDGVYQYLILTEFSIAGINPEDGSVLWKANYPGRSIVCSDPVQSEGFVFASSAYTVGAVAWKVEKNGKNFSVQQLYANNKFDNKHFCIMPLGGYLYFATDRGSFLCIDLKTGKVQWEERRMRGKASVSFADGKLILRKENTGELILIQANPKKYTEISRFKQPDRTDKNAWTYPFIVNGKMYVRDQDSVYCYNLKK
ncbi:MAG: PQQ-like beta-propeller repeat protein [Planctomycetia bacterium]|nr:PQQ-like beta-propeller repeat protein [Planctomycetia bacterium]